MEEVECRIIWLGKRRKVSGTWGGARLGICSRFGVLQVLNTNSAPRIHAWNIGRNILQFRVWEMTVGKREGRKSVGCGMSRHKQYMFKYRGIRI